MIKTLMDLIYKLLLSLTKNVGKKTAPKTEGTILGGELEDLFRTKFPGVTTHLMDYKYRLAIKAEVEKFLAEDPINTEGYIIDEHDCDDFSFELMGVFNKPGWSDITFGLVFTDVHALNCIVDENRKFWFLEPQSDQLSETLDTSWQGTKVKTIIM